MLSHLSEIRGMAPLTPWQVIEEALARKRPVRGPKWLADQLGEKIQTVMNWKSRGVPARRYRDVAGALGITVDQLEGVAPLPWPRMGEAEWPFSDELRQKVLTLSDEELSRLENVMRAHLDMPQQMVSDLTHDTQLATTANPAHPYAHARKESTGLPSEMEVPDPQQHVKGETNQRRQQRKSGGRA